MEASGLIEDEDQEYRLKRARWMKDDKDRAVPIGEQAYNMTDV